jgi:hypothetical protein
MPYSGISWTEVWLEIRFNNLLYNQIMCYDKCNISYKIVIKEYSSILLHVQYFTFYNSAISIVSNTSVCYEHMCMCHICNI